ncbi:NAD(P)H-binding protein [Phytohabitans flavus]|nr:NAD(P)H-binding protein [Phytohabitans flavus]
MTDSKQILVTGATGNIGRHVVAGLLDRGVSVRALTRTPALAGLPDGVEAVAGDLTRPDTLRDALAGVDAVFLLWPFLSAEGVEEVARAIAEYARHVVYVSAANVDDARTPAENGLWGQVEDAVRRSGVEWTFLRPTGFATNTLEWADAIRAGRPVRIPYPEAARSLIHERDIADVAVRALTSPRHRDVAYVLSGPAAVTQAEQVRILGAAAGRPVPVEEATRDEARAAMLAWADADFADGALAYWASLVDSPERVTGTVAELTGRPARTFAEWAADHAGDFRPDAP